MSIEGDDFKFTNGLKCPACGVWFSREEDGPSTLGGHIIEYSEDNQAYAVTCSCSECGGEWEDLYVLIGYRNLVKGEAP